MTDRGENELLTVSETLRCEHHIVVFWLCNFTGSSPLEGSLSPRDVSLSRVSDGYSRASKIFIWTDMETFHIMIRGKC